MLSALLCCGGALVVHQLPRLPGPAWLVPFAILALTALERPQLRWLMIALVAAAWTAFSAQRNLDDRLPAALTGQDFEVSGWVDGFPAGNAERKTFSFRVQSAKDPAVPRRLRLGWYDAPETLQPGATLNLTVRLRAPRGLLNPGGFDYEQWLLVESYGATGYVRAGAAASDEGLSPARWWLRMRRGVADTIGASAPDQPAAALLTALAIGERFGFSEIQWTHLRRSGTSHLVAISGMHVGLIAMLVFFCTRRAWLVLPQSVGRYDLEAAAVAGGVAAVSYAALAGFAVPTQRAVVMVIVALWITAGRRAVAPASGLAVALIAVLLWDPFAVMSASFWMSFAAVALLLVLALRQDLHLRSERGAARVRSRLATLAILQCGISFGLVPITALFFGEFSVVSPLVNFVAIPFFSFLLVPATLAAVLVSCLDLPGAAPLIYTVGWLANGAWAGIHLAGSWAWSAAGVVVPAASVAALALVGVVAGLPAHPLPGRWLGWCALLPVLLPGESRPLPGTAEATVLDVGHGLSVIVETHGHRLLYDAGPRFPSGYDSGAEVVLPALSQRSWAGLDLLIVSHADNDHSGGAKAVIAGFPHAGVLKGPDVDAIPGRFCEAGQGWTWDGVAFDLLHPPPAFAWQGNESSCVLKITTPHGALLITGDAESRAERLLAGRPDVAAEVVVVGHHGSATSSLPQFVRSTAASLALVSAGHANRWGFPRPEVVRRWQASGAEMWVTGASGALSLRLGEEGITITGERHRRHRYWRTERNAVSGASDPGAL